MVTLPEIPNNAAYVCELHTPFEAQPQQANKTKITHKRVTFHTLVKPTKGQVIPKSISTSKPEIALHKYFQKPQDQAVCV